MTCPQPDRLALYLLGALPASELDSVSFHLEACPECQARIESLEDNRDSLLRQLQHLAKGHPRSGDPELQHLVSRAKALGGTPIVDRFGLGDAAVVSGQPPDKKRIGDYELLKKLGAGTFGTVYLARGQLLQRLVAVKILQDAHRAKPEAKARFLQEMRAVGQLESHPHVVQAFQASEEEGTLYLVMEYVEGTDLGRLIKKQRALAVPDACEAVRQAALGLHHVHAHGLVHRDVKPGNLMVTVQGQVKVLDLGLARLVEESSRDARRTTVGQIMGTHDYMAPEQARDARQADCRADVYSLGCTLFRLLAGKVPFPGDNKLDKIEAHRRLPPPALADFRPDISSELQSVVSRMMAKDPADRYQTSLEAATELERFCKGSYLPALVQSSRVAPRRAEPTTTLYRPQHRRWWGAWALAGILLVAVGFWVSGWRSKRPEEVPPGPVAVLTGHEGPGYSLAISVDGRRAVSDDGIQLHCWDLATRQRLGAWHHGSAPVEHANVALTADGEVAVLGLNNPPRLQRCDVRRAKPLGSSVMCNGALLCVAVAPDGNRVLTAEDQGKIRIWDGQENNSSQDHELEATVRSAVFSTDGQSVLCGCDDGVLRLCSLDKHAPRSFRSVSVASPAFVVAVALSTDGRRVCSATLADHAVRVWKVGTGALDINWDLADWTCAAFAVEGRLALTGHSDGSVAVWDVDRQNQLARFTRHQGAVQSVAVTPDGRWALSAGGKDRLVWLYRLPALPALAGK